MAMPMPQEAPVEIAELRLLSVEDRTDPTTVVEGLAIFLTPKEAQALRNEFLAVIGHELVQQTRTQTYLQWGAKETVEVLLAIWATLQGLEAGASLIDRIKARLAGGGSPPFDAAEAARRARGWIASCLGIAEEDIRVTKVVAKGPGFEVTLETPVGGFTVSVWTNGFSDLKRTRTSRKAN